LVTNGIKIVEARDFKIFPVWRYDEDDDLYFPVLEGRDLPDSERDISILVDCTAKSGHQFNGYIVGIRKVFSMGLFCAEKTFYVNKNLSDLSFKQMQEFLECTGLSDDLNIDDLFPLKFTTKINRDEFIDFSGTFEMNFAELSDQR
jgi:hypothetical protein